MAYHLIFILMQKMFKQNFWQTSCEFCGMAWLGIWVCPMAWFGDVMMI